MVEVVADGGEVELAGDGLVASVGDLVDLVEDGLEERVDGLAGADLDEEANDHQGVV